MSNDRLSPRATAALWLALGLAGWGAVWFIWQMAVILHERFVG